VGIRLLQYLYLENGFQKTKSGMGCGCLTKIFSVKGFCIMKNIFLKMGCENRVLYYEKRYKTFLQKTFFIIQNLLTKNVFYNTKTFYEKHFS